MAKTNKRYKNLSRPQDSEKETRKEIIKEAVKEAISEKIQEMPAENAVKVPAKANIFDTLKKYWLLIPFGVIFLLPLKKAFHVVCSFKHLFIAITVAILVLYYPLGGYLISHVDRNIETEITPAATGRSATVETMSYLIDREVNQKLWTPNLPFLFPSYFLDNMPSFQLGIIDSIADFSNHFNKAVAHQASRNFDEATQLLHYSGKIWMFSPQNKLLPVPSANTQYRKARKNLLKYNEGLASGTSVFARTPEELSYMIKGISKGLNKSVYALENQIREFSPSYVDFKSDDVFYYNQGRVYAYYMLLKGLGQDYKDIVVSSNLYQTWTVMLKALETGASLSPSVVRNGELNSFSAPNHLSYMNFYIVKSQNIMQKITIRLDAQRKVTANAN